MPPEPEKAIVTHPVTGEIIEVNSDSNSSGEKPLETIQEPKAKISKSIDAKSIKMILQLLNQIPKRIDEKKFREPVIQLNDSELDDLSLAIEEYLAENYKAQLTSGQMLISMIVSIAISKMIAFKTATPIDTLPDPDTTRE